MKRLVLGILIVVVGLIVLIAGTLGVRHVRQKEWAPPDVAVNLESKWPVLREADVQPDSAFDLLHRAADAQSRLFKSADANRELTRLQLEPWSNESFPVLAKALEESIETLRLARLAALAPNPQTPTYTSITDRFDYIGGLMHLTNSFRISSAQKAGTGDIGGAFEELETAALDAQILSRGGPLILMLVGITGETGAYRAMRLSALQHEIPPEVASRAIQRLQSIAASTEPIDETFRQEYRVVPNIVNLMFNPNGSSIVAFDEEAMATKRRLRWLFKWFGWTVGSTRAEVATDLTRLYKAVIATAAQPYSTERMDYLENRVVPKLGHSELFLYRDPAGYILANATAPMFPGITTRFHRRAADLNATMIVLAIRQFQQNEHRAPAGVDELVPKYLSAVPNDPFSAMPLKYRIDSEGKWVVYSVGPNQIDEGGVRPKTEPRNYKDAGDIVFSESDLEWERERLKNIDKKP